MYEQIVYRILRLKLNWGTFQFFILFLIFNQIFKFAVNSFDRTKIFCNIIRIAQKFLFKKEGFYYKMLQFLEEEKYIQNVHHQINLAQTI